MLWWYQWLENSIHLMFQLPRDKHNAFRHAILVVSSYLPGFCNLESVALGNWSFLNQRSLKRRNHMWHPEQQATCAFIIIIIIIIINILKLIVLYQQNKATQLLLLLLLLFQIYNNRNGRIMIPSDSKLKKTMTACCRRTINKKQILN